MGSAPIEMTGQFAYDVARHIQKLIVAAGGDSSGRWLENRTDRSHGYWAKRQTLTTPYNVSEVDTIAKIFGMSPLELVEGAIGEVTETKHLGASIMHLPKMNDSGRDYRQHVRLHLHEVAASDDNTDPNYSDPGFV